MLAQADRSRNRAGRPRGCVARFAPRRGAGPGGARQGSLRSREGQARKGGQTAKTRALRAEARQLDSAIQELVRERKSIPSHLRAAELEPEDRIETLPEAERLLPDPAAGTLTVRLHHPTTWGRERQLELLLADLNASRTRFPDTNLRLVYDFAGLSAALFRRNS